MKEENESWVKRKKRKKPLIAQIIKGQISDSIPNRIHLLHTLSSKFFSFLSKQPVQIKAKAKYCQSVIAFSAPKPKISLAIRDKIAYHEQSSVLQQVTTSSISYSYILSKFKPSIKLQPSNALITKICSFLYNIFYTAELPCYSTLMSCPIS